MKKQECDDIFGTLQQAPNISSYERSLTKVKRRQRRVSTEFLQFFSERL